MLPWLVVLWFAASAIPSRGAQGPLATTQPAGPIRATYATLAGMAVPRGYPTIAWFEWGPDENYGLTTDPVSIGNGQAVVRVTASVTDLVTGGVYHFRLVASNSVGVVRGYEQRFTTGMRIQSWGSFDNGLPAVPVGLTNIVAVAAGHGHALAIRNDGTVAAWMVDTRYSYQNRGQANVPAGLTNVVAVAGGFSHSLALKEDGTVVAWGGYGNSKPADVPAGLTNVIAIAGGDYHSVALKADGTLVDWGYGPNGDTNVPRSLSNVVAVSCGSSHTLALTASGTISSWGSDFGSSPPSSTTPFAIIATEGWYNLAVQTNSRVVSSGMVATDVPMPSNLTNIIAVGTGYGHGEVLRADGTLVGWGTAAATAAIPARLSNVVAFASGDFHRIGLAPVNLAPICRPAAVVGGTNQDLVVPLAASGFDPNGDSAVFRLTSLPAHGRLFQYTPACRGDPITAPGTPLTDSSRVIFVPDPDTYGLSYASFSFVLGDGELESDAATCVVSIIPPPVLQLPAVPASASAGFQLNFTGLADAVFSVQASTDLNSWVSLGTSTQAAPGQFSFTDAKFTNYPVRFYRIRTQ